jgi:hypothetical protein
MKQVFNSNIFKFSKKANELSTDISSLEHANNKFNVYKHSNFIIQSNKTKKQIEFIYKNETRDLDLKLIVITYVPTTKSILENPQLKDTILHIFNT